MKSVLIIFAICSLAFLYSSKASAACFYNESESEKSVVFICGLFCADDTVISGVTPEKSRPDRRCRASESGLVDAFSFLGSKQEAVCLDTPVSVNSRLILLSDESVEGCEVLN